MARSPITSVVAQFQNLTLDEQKLFLDLVDPQPEPEEAKRARKKTKRAEPLSDERRKAIQKRGMPLDGAKVFGQATKGRICGVCGNVEDHPDHDTEHYLSAHPFPLTAPSAGKKSSRKNAATNSTAGTGANIDSALDVVHGAIGEL